MTRSAHFESWIEGCGRRGACTVHEVGWPLAHGQHGARASHHGAQRLGVGGVLPAFYRDSGALGGLPVRIVSAEGCEEQAGERLAIGRSALHRNDANRPFSVRQLWRSCRLGCQSTTAWAKAVGTRLLRG